MANTQGVRRARSPIEMMVDEACGVTAEDLEIDHDAKALMDVGTAAVAWVKLRDNGTLASRVNAEEELVKAAQILAATGW